MTFTKTLAFGLALLAASSTSGCKPGERSDPRTDSPVAAVSQERSTEPARRDQEVTDPDGSQPAEPIEIAVLRPEPVVDGIEVSATVHQDHHRLAQVSTRVPGRVTKVLVHQGNRVKAGQPLAILDSPEASDAIAQRAQAEAQLQFATREHARIATLVDEEVLPRKELVRAESELARVTAQYQGAASRARLLEAEGGPGRESGTFLLRAPIAGVVVEKGAVIGELAQPDRPLFAVADLSVVWVEANLGDEQLALVRTGAPASVRVASRPERSFEGHVTYIGSSADPVTRTVLARIEVPNPDNLLLPMMLASAHIQATDGPGRESLVVPASAITRMNGADVVFVQERGAFEPVVVRARRLPDGRHVIEAGLQSGQRVAIRGAFEIKSRLLKAQFGDTH